MNSESKRMIVKSVRVSEEENQRLVAMARQLHLPVQELLRRGGLREGQRSVNDKKRKFLRKLEFFIE